MLEDEARLGEESTGVVSEMGRSEKLCYECGALIPETQANEMLKEVI